MKRVLIMTLMVLGMAGISEAKPRHALAKLGKVMSAPVVHPKRSLKQVLGTVLFMVESGNDILLGALDGADKVASVEFKYNPFHYAALVDGKVDKGLEAAELYLFGSSN